MKKLDRLAEKLTDSRSKKVIFISHCVLNVNTRYLGGAFRYGSVNEIINDVMEKGIGIIQIKCPEQHAWGGIRKWVMWIPFDSKNSLTYYFIRLFMPLFLFYTRLIYRRIAGSLVDDISNYIKSGFTVTGIIGADGSPSCGVNLILNMKKSFEYYASSKISNVDRDRFNFDLYKKCSESGSGIFIDEVKKQLIKRNLRIPIYAHNLVSEMQGEISKIKF